MTMTQLVYFVAVAEEQNITRIAEQFHVSQPAVSSAIRDLEKEFRVSLFERHHNDLFLTSTGYLLNLLANNNSCLQNRCILLEQEDKLEDDFQKMSDVLLRSSSATFMYRDFQSRNVMRVILQSLRVLLRDRFDIGSVNPL